MLGGTEYIAEACQETLLSLGHNVELHLQPNYQEIAKNNQIWLICTSTHGAGDYPDNIAAFVDSIENSSDDLHGIPFFVIGVGDSSYDTFCLAAKNLSSLLKSKGCKEIIPLKTYDMLDEGDPEELAQIWIEENKDHL